MFKRQNPIDSKKKWKFDSYIGRNTSWWHYYSQYKEVIDEMVTNIENNTPIDTVSLPLMFLIRHSLELGLKANILKLEPVNNGVEKIKLSGSNSHSLEFLFDRFTLHLETVKKNYEISSEIRSQMDIYLNDFSALKDKLHKLDKGSFNFRYPVDTKGDYNFTWDTRENLSEIINLYYSIQPFLVFTDAVLYEEGVFGFEE